jgi:hypothetical protein
MIKPNTLCMIRGILPTSRGYDSNGMIVVAVKPETIVGKQAWYIQPHIHSRDGLFLGVLQENLFPLDNPTDDEVDTLQQLRVTHD